MAGDIATAYVRVRPNMEGFQSSVQEGVKSGFANVAKIVGVAFGAKEAFDLGKDIVGHAADLQKQVEAIKEEFGSASKSVLEFNDNAAAGLGISAHEADTTSAKFGILFKNLGIGGQQAATMTVGFEKLAGSLASIRGLDPSTVLKNLPLAVAGNLRSLKQLGIATDSAQLSVAAFKLGLTSSITQALTPAQRAIAIYAVATKNLTEFQAQAAAHSGDLVNVERRLSAEWDNAKDKLGAGLLPVITKFLTIIDAKLPGAITAVQKDIANLSSGFDSIKQALAPVDSTLGTFVKDIGGVKGAMEALLATFAVVKIVAFANAIKTSLIAGGFAELQIATKAEQAAYLEAFGSMEIATIGLGATIKSALITTGFGAIAVAVGILLELVVTHFGQIKAVAIATANNIGEIWKGLKTLLIGVGEEIAGSMTTSLLAPLLALVKATSFLSGLLDRIGIHIGDGAKDALKGLESISTDLITKGAANVAKGGEVLGGAFADGFKTGMKKPGKGLDVNVFFDALKSLQDKAKDVIAVGLAAGVGQGGGNGAGTQPNAIDAAITSAEQSLAALQVKLKQAIAKEASDITAAVNKAKQNLISIGSSLADSIGQVVDAPYVAASARIQAAQDKLAVIFDVKNAALAAQSAKLNALQSQLGLNSDKLNLENLRRELVLPGGGTLSGNNTKALAQLKALAAKAGTATKPALEAFITQFQGAALQVAQDKLGIKQTKLSNEETRKTTPLDIASAKNAVGQDAADQVKLATNRTIANLTQAFNKGSIGVVQFSKGIANLLKKDNVSYKKAGSLLGVAFSQGFKEQAQGLITQALAIEKSPTRAGNGQESTIVRPLATIAKDNAAIKKIQTDIGNKQVSLQAKLLKQAEKQSALLKSINSVQLGDTAKAVSKNPGKQSKVSQHMTGTTG